jgi:hypothetical protein
MSRLTDVWPWVTTHLERPTIIAGPGDLSDEPAWFRARRLRLFDAVCAAFAEVLPLITADECAS